MTKEQIEQAQAAADNITNRLIHLSDDIKQLYDAVSRIDCEADDFRAELHDLCYKLKISYEWTE